MCESVLLFFLQAQHLHTHYVTHTHEDYVNMQMVIIGEKKAEIGHKTAPNPFNSQINYSRKCVYLYFRFLFLLLFFLQQPTTSSLFSSSFVAVSRCVCLITFTFTLVYLTIKKTAPNNIKKQSKLEIWMNVLFGRMLLLSLSFFYVCDVVGIFNVSFIACLSYFMHA